MEPIALRYGKGTLNLTVNPNIIGVKPKPGKQEIIGQMTRGLDGGGAIGRVGGFQLIDTGGGTRGLDDGGANAQRVLDSMRRSPAVQTGTHVFNNNGGSSPLVPTGEIFVNFHADASGEACQKLLAGLSLMFVEAKSETSFIVRCTPRSPNPISATIALQQSPLVEMAEPDLAMPISYNAVALPTDEFFVKQWHLRNTGPGALGAAYSGLFKPGADAKVVDAWNLLNSYGSAGTVIAIIDDGFDITHPDFAEKGKIVAPWDFIENSSTLKIETDDWHGTCCAGVALASVNGKGTVGVSPNSRLMPIRNGEISDRQIEFLFDYVSKNGADVVSCSWGINDPDYVLSTRMYQAIEKCATKGRGGRGCVICFASGNDWRPMSGFACHPNVISVGATTSIDEHSDYANFGPNLTICAPSSGGGGWPILTTDVGTYTTPEGASESGGYSAGLYNDGFGGTSSACPLMAGVCALILAANPNLTAAEVKQIAIQTADKVGDPSEYNAEGHSDNYGYGRVNACKAVQMAMSMRPQVSQQQLSGTANVGFRAVDRFYNAAEEKLYKVTVGTNLVVDLASGSFNPQDFEVLVSKGGVPTPAHFTASMSRNGQNGRITIPNATAGDYYILVKPKTGSGDFSLNVRMG